MSVQVLPLHSLIHRIGMLAGAARAAYKTLYAAHEVSAMTDPARPANQRRLRKLGILK